MSGNLYNSENLGRTPHYFWYGQVVGGPEWEDNQKDDAIAKHKIHTRDDIAGWGHRCKVAIMGYDPRIVDDRCAKNSELVMAEVMIPATGGGGIGGPVMTPTIGNNSFVVGFYKDGISAREPIIMGVLPNVSQSRLKSYDSTEKTRYDAATGYRPGEDPVANDALWGEGPSSSPIMEAGEIARSYTVMLKAQLDDGLRTFPLPATYNCSRKCNGGLQAIQTILGQLMNVLGLSKGAQFVNQASDALRNYNAILATAQNAISGYIRGIIQDIRSTTLNFLNRETQRLLDLLPPNIRSITSDTNTNVVLNALTCAFNKVLGLVKGLIGNFLSRMIGGAVNAAFSTAESVFGFVLTNIFGTISDAIGSALGSLASALGPIANIAGTVLNVLDVVFGALNIFSCKEELSCATITSWSWLFGNSQANPCLGSIKDLSVGSIVSGSPQAASNFYSPNNVRSGTSPILSGPPLITTSGGGTVPGGTTSAISSTTGGIGIVGIGTVGIGTTTTASGIGTVGIGTTTPASGTFFANPVISPDGQIIAIDIINGGSGFTNTPNIIISDPSGNGRGAVAIPIMEDDNDIEFDVNGCGNPNVNLKYPNINKNLPPITSKRFPDYTSTDNKTENLGGGPYHNPPLSTLTPSIINIETPETPKGKSIRKIVILDSGVGYLPRPDGSTGANGQRFSNPEDTIVFCGGYNVYPPGSNVRVSKGDKIYLPVGTTGQIFNDNGELIQTSIGRGPTNPINVEETGTLATPLVTREEVVPIVEGLSQYNVTLEIGDVYIDNPGINYSPDDVITIEPSNGSILEPKYDSLGKLIDVKIINPGIGFTEFPTIRIYSDTGVNAKIIPIFNVIRITDEVIERDIIPAGTPLVSVIDCVGIQPPKREFDIVPQ